MLKGKGVWIWQIRNCEKGDIPAIVAKASMHGLSHVLVKVADGAKLHSANRKLYSPLITALQEANIQAWIWQYAYGNHPEAEARLFAQIALDERVDGLVIDAEVEYKGHPSRAMSYGETLRGLLPRAILVALSSYYLPSYHAMLPWREFLKYCNLNMPQIYWGRRDPVWAISKSYDENTKFGVPIFPTIAVSNANKTLRGLERIYELGLPGFNIWSWQHMGTVQWNILRDSPLFDSVKIIRLSDEEVIQCGAKLVAGELWVKGRPFAEALGHHVYAQHLRTQRKIYVG